MMRAGIPWGGRLWAAQPSSPAVVIYWRKATYPTRARGLRVLVDEEESAWHGGPEEFDAQGVGVYSPAHFPSGSMLGARGKGVSEEGRE